MKKHVFPKRKWAFLALFCGCKKLKIEFHPLETIFQKIAVKITTYAMVL
jgi:hypothetical protein